MRRPAARFSIALVLAAAEVAAGRAATPESNTVEIHAAWKLDWPDLEPLTLTLSDCSSPDGHVLVFGQPIRPELGRTGAVLVSPDGKGEMKSFPELPGAGKFRHVSACRWLSNDTLLVLGETEEKEFGAAWLDSRFAAERWLRLEPADADTHPSSIAEVAPGRFVVVGMNRLLPVALRFDQRQVSPIALTWGNVPHKHPGDTPQGQLNDVIADGAGGFAVCGVEFRREGGPVMTAEIVATAFDQAGAVRAEARFPGGTCRFLPSKPGQLRLLHDDGKDPRTESASLLMATLGERMETLSEEPLMSDFVRLPLLAAFVLDDRLLFVSPRFAAETLEVRAPSLRQSVDLNIDYGGFIDLLPGPSRVYVIESTNQHDRPPSRNGFGLRVHALDIQDGTR
jgi:hypothetical protein